MGDRRGLLLPGVATDHGLDALGFLEQVCRKAGLPSNAWQDDAAQLATFEGVSWRAPLAAETDWKRASLSCQPIRGRTAATPTVGRGEHRARLAGLDADLLPVDGFGRHGPIRGHRRFGPPGRTAGLRLSLLATAGHSHANDLLSTGTGGHRLTPWPSCQLVTRLARRHRTGPRCRAARKCGATRLARLRPGPPGIADRTMQVDWHSHTNRGEHRRSWSCDPHFARDIRRAGRCGIVSLAVESTVAPVSISNVPSPVAPAGTSTRRTSGAILSVAARGNANDKLPICFAIRSIRPRTECPRRWYLTRAGGIPVALPLPSWDESKCPTLSW